MQTSNIRRFQYSDLDELLALAQTYCQEQGWEDLDTVSFAGYILKINKEGVIFIYEKDFSIRGAMAIMETYNPFNGIKMLMQCDLFVDQRFRHQGIANELRDHATRFAKALGIEKVTWE